MKNLTLYSTPLDDVVKDSCGGCDSTRRSTSMVMGELLRLGCSWSARRIMSELYCLEELDLPVIMRELVTRDNNSFDGEYRQAGWSIN